MFTSMLNRKSAAEAATKHLTELVPVAGTPVVEEHFQVEDLWQITLSYIPADSQANNGSPAAKEYKTFAVDARSGEVLSMKIRSMRP